MGWSNQGHLTASKNASWPDFTAHVDTSELVSTARFREIFMRVLRDLPVYQLEDILEDRRRHEI
jgi:hypothetical protein